jgi:hypothetical protein
MSVQNVNISTNNVVLGNMILSIINENNKKYDCKINQLDIKINNLTKDVEKISNKKWKFFKLFLFIILNLF